jgi:hypothetical protein
MENSKRMTSPRLFDGERKESDGLHKKSEQNASFEGGGRIVQIHQ